MTMTRGKLARLCGVGPETVRFYERRGLIPEAPRSSAGYRRFDQAAVDRLTFIRRAKSLGFSLPEIAELLSLHRDSGGDRARVKELAESKLREIEAKIEDLDRMRSALSDLSRQCSGKGPVSGCPIIETLARGPAPDPMESEPLSARRPEHD